MIAFNFTKINWANVGVRKYMQQKKPACKLCGSAALPGIFWFHAKAQREIGRRSL
jgi:hypothetical protein